MSGDSWEGSGIIDTVHDTVTGISSGEFSGIDGVTASLSVLGFVANPFEGLFSAGIGWLMENLPILEEPLNALAGDPDAIDHASTLWAVEVKGDLASAQGDLASAVARVSTEWTFEAAAAYESVASQLQDTLTALQQSCDGVASSIELGGALMAAVRGLIRDLIADFVAEVVWTFLAAAAASWFTLGGSVAAFVSNAVLKASILGGKIASKISKLITKLADLLDRFSQLAALVRRLRAAAVRFDGLATTIGRAASANARTAAQTVADVAARARAANAAYEASAPVRAARAADDYLGGESAAAGAPSKAQATALDLALGTADEVGTAREDAAEREEADR